MSLYDFSSVISTEKAPEPVQDPNNSIATNVIPPPVVPIVAVAQRAALQRGLVPVKRKQQTVPTRAVPVSTSSARPSALSSSSTTKNTDSSPQMLDAIAASIPLPMNINAKSSSAAAAAAGAGGAKGRKKRKKQLAQQAERAAAAAAAAFMFEDYDPGKPNEYEPCRRAAKRRKYEERNRVANPHEDDDENDYSRQHRSGNNDNSPDDSDGDVDGIPLSSPPQNQQQQTQNLSTSSAPPAAAVAPVLHNDNSGEDAYMRRMRMSLQASQPPPQPPPISQINADEDGDDDDDIDGVPLNPGSLGRNPSNSPAIVSRVVLLRNVVGPGDVDDALEGEIAEECSRFGRVERCMIFEMPNGQVRDEEAVRIFVKFDTVESAQRAGALNGRFFGGRSISYSLFPEDRFDRYDLAPRDGN